MGKGKKKILRGSTLTSAYEVAAVRKGEDQEGERGFKKLKIQNRSSLRPFHKGKPVLPVLEAPEVPQR